MGILQYLGLDELADGIQEFTEQIDGLRDDIVSSIMETADDSKQAVADISESLSGEKSEPTN
jgi:phage-related minor tail protein